ncbi:MAG: TRAP transporter substrate-binding protein [Methylobacteriaceae bacterium]|jgi:tripartite ATP-independent transporter DctP family solute receptor|nr:TRAP transporter substrate-binding protein [Methylobacteriaceae bacterium]
MKKIVASAAALCLVSGSTMAAPKIAKMGHELAPVHYEHVAMTKMADYVKEKTNGSLIIEVYHSGQLGSNKEVMEAMKYGTVQLGTNTPAGLGNFVKEFSLFALPLVFPDAETAQKIADGPWGQDLLSRLERIGYVGLAYGDFGFRQTTNNVRPIKSVDDFAGLKIRLQPNPVHLAVFRELGANPVSMAFSEVFSALQQGVIDGEENPLGNITTAKFYEVQKYLTLTNHASERIAMVASKQFYDSLTAEEQQALREGANIARDHMRSAVAESDRQSLEEIRKNGTTEINEISPEVLAEMLKKAWPAIEKAGNEINPELFKSLMAEIDRVKNEK